MAQISKILRNWRNPDNGDEGLSFFCPGCRMYHSIKVKGGGAWGWNGNADRPTFTPSVLVSWPANPDAGEEFQEWRTERRCHSFVTEGRILFLSDCTHELAGKTVDIPELPKWAQDE